MLRPGTVYVNRGRGMRHDVSRVTTGAGNVHGGRDAGVILVYG